MNISSMLKEISARIDGNQITKLFSDSTMGSSSQPRRIGRSNVLVITNRSGRQALHTPVRTHRNFDGVDCIFHTSEGEPPKLIRSLLETWGDRASQVLDQHRATWGIHISLTSENGLRTPQRGALLSTFSHWSKSSVPATVVMPTGTGKTETLLATIAALRPRLSVIVVPTDALRHQCFEKALTWGRLPSIGCLKGSSEFPAVGMLRSRFSSREKMRSFLEKCQILVTTMHLMSQMDAEWISDISESCDFLAIDEAHHKPADNWSRIIRSFSSSKIIQYTATPFRNDGRYIEGEIIYEYPLLKCQEEGYFKGIRFLPITEYVEERQDSVIAQSAVAQLRRDLSNGLDHSLMARASSIAKARTLLPLYARLAGDLAPVLIHNLLTEGEKSHAKQSLLGKTSRIVICVDMFGEGFDFPNLKIAAIHDAHRSLPITLQFIGRFTRNSSDNIGDAAVIANIADRKVAENISALYSQDADWNHIIQGSYDMAVGSVVDYNRFLSQFRHNGIRGFSLRNIEPKFNAFVYASCATVDWDSVEQHYNDGKVNRSAVSRAENFGVIVSREDASVEWGDIRSLVNTNFHCTAVFHDEPTNFLFVFTSQGEPPDELAERMSAGCRRLSDPKLQRCFSGIKRVMLMNVGLKRRIIGPITYRSYIGPDVGTGMRERTANQSIAVVAFGVGYESGKKASIGCSLKGKIWSRDSGNLLEWSNWCRGLSQKLSNDQIDPSGLFDGFLYPESISRIPDERTPVVADWSDFFFENLYSKTQIIFGEEVILMDSCDVVLGPISEDRSSFVFFLRSEYFLLQYRHSLTGSQASGYEISRVSGEAITIKIGKSEVADEAYFQRYPPIVWFDDTSCLMDGCLYVRAGEMSIGSELSHDRIDSIPWHDVDITHESQGPERRTGTIQRKIIEMLSNSGCSFVFDDDGSGEVADVICCIPSDHDLVIRLYHLKYSSEPVAGLRASDVYELSGQAQKSVKWAGSVPDLVDHISKRERLRLRRNQQSRFQSGDLSSVVAMKAAMRSKRVVWEMVLVQPGILHAELISDSTTARSVRRILGATAAYLADTYQIGMRVLVNDGSSSPPTSRS